MLIRMIKTLKENAQRRKEFRRRCPGHTRMLMCADCNYAVFEKDKCVGCHLADEIGI